MECSGDLSGKFVIFGFPFFSDFSIRIGFLLSCLLGFRHVLLLVLHGPNL